MSLQAIRKKIKKIVSEAFLTEEKRIKIAFELPAEIIKIKNVLKKAGYDLFVVGGAVRDLLLDKKPKDFDLATNALPQTVQDLLSPYYRTLETGKNFGIIIVLTQDGEYEIATFRKDIGAGRRPDSVEFTTIDNDVKRRDLTINALFYDIDKGEVVDLVGGVDDLRNNIVRTVGKAEERFEEDPLRIMRFFRFSAQAGKLDEKADESLRKSVPLLGNVSKERIRDEFLKGIKSAKSVVFFLSIFKKYNAFRFLFGDLIIRDDFIEERDYNVLIAYLLQDNPVDKTKMVLNAHRYSIEEVARVAFLMSLKTLSIQSAPRFKKLQKNSHLTNEQIVTYAKWTGLQSKLIDAFLKFELSVSGNEYLAQGLKGKEIANAIEKQEIENFTKLL
jgi:tRNA nucleotidyltransferase/poly(A) polymerase